MAKKQFKAESKRLLDLMINSIYTHKEIFLRELISNASDAIDKLYYKSLADGATGLNRDDFQIFLAADKDSRTLRIRDNGIGMTQEELDQNLGVIAKSGSLKFKSENEKNEDIDIIGQFGVYSAPYALDSTCAWNPRRTAQSRRIAGSPTARTAIPSASAKRPTTAPRSFCISKRTPRKKSTASFSIHTAFVRS